MLRNVGRFPFRPVLAHFGRFGGVSRQNGPTGHPAAESVLKRKFGENNGLAGQWSFGNPEHPRGDKDVFIMAGKEFFENLSTFFW